MINFLKFFSILILGVAIGFLIFIILPYFPVSANSSVLSTLGIGKPRIVAFLPYFLVSKATNDYNPYITTLTYFGLTIDVDGHIVKLANPQQEDPGWHGLRTHIVQDKLQSAKDNGVELSLSVVQGDEESISELLNNPKQSAENLLSDVIPQMKKYGFTDLNIDIESFDTPDAKKVEQFTTFVRVVKDGLEKQNSGTVTVDIPPIAFIRTNMINPIEVGKIADYMFVMAYDYSSVLSSNTGPIAPLEGAGKISEFDVAMAIDIAKKEIDPQKIILGIPLYGYEWDSLSDVPGAATIPDTGQTASNRRITDTFNSLCDTCIVVEDDVVKEKVFIYQERKDDLYFHQAFLVDADDVKKRIDFVRNNDLGGIGLWALGYEGDKLLKPLSLYKDSFSFK
jgi:spore germination protein YaaH